MTVPQMVAAFRASNPALGGDADNYVAISVHAYCPQNGNLVSGP
jgi:roadblock/LC7 domain-containing protein